MCLGIKPKTISLFSKISLLFSNFLVELVWLIAFQTKSDLEKNLIGGTYKI